MTTTEKSKWTAKHYRADRSAQRIDQSFLNVLATFVRHGGADVADARMLWRCAAGLFEDATMEIDMEEALELAVRGNASAYDAQHVVLARQLRTVCVTEDRRLLRAFPAVARTMEQVCGP